MGALDQFRPDRRVAVVTRSFSDPGTPFWRRHADGPGEDDTKIEFSQAPPASGFFYSEMTRIGLPAAWRGKSGGCSCTSRTYIQLGR